MPNKLNKVKHLVVLMLENRSFDHLLGYLKALGIKPAIDGLTGTETIPTDPVSGTGPVTVSSNAGDTEPDPDAGHEIADVSRQFYGQVNLTFPPGGPMNGFIASYAGQSPAPASPGDIMKCVHPTRIPALAELATRFCVCDRWFASVPGSTWPNRMFAHAATSDGAVTNVVNLVFRPTIFDWLSLRGRDWRIYYHDLPQAALFASLFAEWLVSPITRRFRLFPRRWKKDLAGNRCRLPEYTFIEPRYFTLGSVPANDQHPSHSIARADRLVRAVYEPLRASPCWEHSMLIIVHDEHGGTYDHRFPDPATVSPDGLSQMPPFNFTRYGARVPAVIVSPWASDGVCSDVYDHASIPATLEQRFGLPPLTARDLAANSLGGCLTRSQPRLTPAEAPLKLAAAALRQSRADRRALNPRRHGLSSLQATLVRLADHIRIPGEDRSKLRPLASIRTEQQGAEFVKERVAALIRATRPGPRPRRRATRAARRRGRRRGR
ncbi:MAG TPA: alkaline phosphatase family protein [Methylomirabilota bacterium]|nr:alkaline phosphatase family protein [Methylomirabilota bacterium]